MVFYIPTERVCPKCDTRVMHSRSAPAVNLVDEKGNPFCPTCLLKFLKQHVPVMHNTGIRSDR